jgi:osmotically-inducible protein OsmY
MKKHFSLTLPVIAIFLAASSPALAQYGVGQNAGGMGGLGMSTFTQGMGQTSQANGTFGQRSFGGASVGTPSRTAMGGAGGGGSNMFGSGQANGMGQGFGIGNGQQQQSGAQVSGSEWFVPGNRQAGQFVGSDSADASNFIGAFSQTTGMAQGGRGGNQFGANQFGGGNQMGANGQRNNRQQGGRQGQNQQNGNSRNGRQNRSPMLRTYVADFQAASIPSVSSSNVGQRLANQLSTSRSVKAIGPVQVTMAGRTAVLQGTVATEQDRDLAARMAMLEPGVSQVRNELQIGSELPPPAPASGSPRPSQVSPSLGP